MRTSIELCGLQELKTCVLAVCSNTAFCFPAQRLDAVGVETYGAASGLSPGVDAFEVGSSFGGIMLS